MENKCGNCIFQVWAVGVGQAVFCIAMENEGKNLGFGVNKQGKPLLPVEEDFVCDQHIKEKDG